MTFNKLILSAAFFLSPVIAMGQGNGVAPSELLKPLKDSWPTYSGDYSGKRYSALTQIDQSNVMHLTLAWMTRVTPGQASGGGGGGRFGRGGGPVIVGGEGPGDINVGGGTIKASALEVDGVLYFTMPDNAWAVDARDGSELWHYFWKTKGGTHIGNRGLGMWNSYLFMETPDDYLVSLDSKTGKERWHKPIADLAQGYFSTPAPVVVGNHVLVGTGNDLDAPGMLQSFDPETGDLQWKILHRADEPRRSWLGHLGQPRRSQTRRWPGVGSGRLRSRDKALHFQHRQSDARLHHRHSRRGRQPVHLRDGCVERGHRKNGLVLLHLASRHARLRFRANPGPGRRNVQRQNEEAGVDGGAQRVLVHAWIA